MTFLNPAILLGLLAASIPVLIHLLNLRKLKKIEFSTLRFLKELQKNKIRKIKLKQWLLLALRVMIIVFLVLAFARPTLEAVSFGGATSAARTSAVFIIDDTFSMSVTDADGSFFNQAKQTIKKITNQFQNGDKAAIMLVSGNEASEVNFSSNFAKLISDLDLTEISAATGNLNEAFVKAAKLLSSSDDFNKEIYIFTDLQKNKIYDEEQLSNFENLLNENIRIYLFEYKADNPFNLGIDSTETGNALLQPGGAIKYFVTVTNYSSTKTGDALLSLFMNGKRTSQKSFSLDAGQSDIVELDATLTDTGFVDLYVSTEDDDILTDNRRFSNFYITSELPVLILYDKMKDIRYITAVADILKDTGKISLKIAESDKSNIIELNNYKMIILTGAGNVSNADKFKSYLQNGGGMFVLPGSDDTAEELNSLLVALGLPAGGSVVNTDRNSDAVQFGNVHYGHPLFTNIFDDENVKIGSPEIKKFFRYNSGGNAIDIISLQDGSVFLSDFKSGSGRVILLTVSPVDEWSNFHLKNIFAPIVTNTIFYLGTAIRENEAYKAGEEITVNLPPSAMKYKLVYPDFREEFISPDELTGKNYKLKNTFSTGNYKLFADDKLVKIISVNHDPSESVTERGSREDFEGYLEQIGFRGKVFYPDPRGNPGEVIVQSRFGTELWRYFLLLALLIAGVEMIIARNTKKDIQQI
ncbi:MAG: BatA domain-containing protein [Ignavibacteriaceae bacterium]